MYWYHNHGGAGLWPFACLIVVLLIAGMVAWWWRAGHRRTQPGVPPQATTVLSERFARGEIDEPEYRQRLHVIETITDR